MHMNLIDLRDTTFPAKGDEKQWTFKSINNVKYGPYSARHLSIDKNECVISVTYISLYPIFGSAKEQTQKVLALS